MRKRLTIVIGDIPQRIYDFRGHRIMLSTDLADLYGVEARVLIQAVKRNLDRFPRDFMFQLNAKEFKVLKSQFVTSSWGGARRARPYAFTEQGVAMLSSVLRSKQAIQLNIHIMRAFVHLRRIALTHSELSKRVAEVEKEVTALGMKQGEQESNIKLILGAVRKLLEAPQPKPKRRIGFRPRK